MINAKDEFIKHTKGNSILCASIVIDSWRGTSPVDDIDLPVGFTIEQLVDFLSKLDREYDNGYGGQELFGKIWYTDGTWSSREEYDGSEWWRYNCVPEIPNQLKGNSNES